MKTKGDTLMIFPFSIFVSLFPLHQALCDEDEKMEGKSTGVDWSRYKRYGIERKIEEEMEEELWIALKVVLPSVFFIIFLTFLYVASDYAWWPSREYKRIVEERNSTEKITETNFRLNSNALSPRDP